MVKPVPDEIIMFLLSKEFGWTPSQIENESSKNIKAYITILSAYNKAKNLEIERSSKVKKTSKGFKGGPGKYMLQETVGPNGIEQSMTPM